VTVAGCGSGTYLWWSFRTGLTFCCQHSGYVEQSNHIWVDDCTWKSTGLFLMIVLVGSVCWLRVLLSGVLIQVSFWSDWAVSFCYNISAHAIIMIYYANWQHRLKTWLDDDLWDYSFGWLRGLIVIFDCWWHLNVIYNWLYCVTTWLLIWWLAMFVSLCHYAIFHTRVDILWSLQHFVPVSSVTPVWNYNTIRDAILTCARKPT